MQFKSRMGMPTLMIDFWLKFTVNSSSGRMIFFLRHFSFCWTTDFVRNTTAVEPPNWNMPNSCPLLMVAPGPTAASIVHDDTYKNDFKVVVIV